MRKFAFALFGLAAALALAALWIHLTSLRSVDAAAIDAATARRFVGVQALGQVAGGLLVLGLIVLFGRREPAQSAVSPDQEAATHRGHLLLIAAGVVLLGLLPWAAASLHRLFQHLIASAPAPDLDDLPAFQAMFDAAFWPTVVMATLPGLALITIGIVKRQRPRAVAPPQRAAARTRSTSAPAALGR